MKKLVISLGGKFGRVQVFEYWLPGFHVRGNRIYCYFWNRLFDNYLAQRSNIQNIKNKEGHQNFDLHIHPLLRHLTMRYFQLALLCFVCVVKTYGQTGTRSYGVVVVEITKEKKPKKILTKVEITSAFPGGDSSWTKSLENSLNKSIPFKNGAKAGKYIVSVRFLLEREGSLVDIDCISDPGFGMCEQVVAAIREKLLKSPRWSPGKVRQYRTSSTTPQDE